MCIRLWVIYPGGQTYALARNVTVLPLAAVADSWQYA
jgi:hypothetical protein